MNEFSTLMRDEQKRSIVMTYAKVQPFCKNHNINIGYYDGFGVCPRNVQKKI